MSVIEGASLRGHRCRVRLVSALLAGMALLVQAPAALAATFTVTTTVDSGAGSLRQAITDVNAAGTGNTIAFAIPGSGTHVIAPASALPAVSTDNTTIDGCTQSGTDCSGLPLALKIRISGQAIPLLADDVTIRGLSLTNVSALGAITFNRWSAGGFFHLPAGTTIEDNYIGLAPDGSAAGNLRALFTSGGQRGGTVLGWDDTTIRNNVIGANTTNALDFTGYPFTAGAVAENVVISGNLIGMDPTGTQARPNGGDGIVMDVTGNLTITNNVIANNVGVGIRHRGRNQTTPGSDPLVSPGTLMQRNTITHNTGGGIVIGPKTAGADPYSGPLNILGNTISENGVAGILITAAVDTIRPNLIVGGVAVGQANTITANSGPGIAIGASSSDTSAAVTVRGNSIYGNGGPRIDLGGDGATTNGPAGSARTGPNQLINFPLISSIAHGSIILAGTYVGATNSVYTLDFYASATVDSAQTWLGSTAVTTDASGTAAYRVELAPDVPAGWYVTATATGVDGSTSEFGVPVLVPAALIAPISLPSPTVSPGPTATPSAPPKAKPRAKPKLALSKRVSRSRVRAGETVTFTLRLRNPSSRRVRSVRLCDRLPAGLVLVRSTPGSRLSSGRHCWTISRLGTRSAKTFMLTARALRGSVGFKTASASAASRDARTDRASRSIHVLPASIVSGGVTG